jgi:hypothetical protein
MKEITLNNTQEKIENKEIQEKPLVEQIKELTEFKKQVMNGDIKTKNIKIPRKAKVRKRKLKKGWIGILRVDENRNITAEKQKVIGSCFKDKEGIYHSTDGREILFWQGKFPIIIQPSWKLNPLKIIPEEEKNETYGQKYTMAKMLSDTIKVKSKGGNIIIWIIAIGAALFGINYFMGGSLFG